ASPDYANRLMCSTFLEAMASRRLARVMLPVLPAKTVPPGTRSMIFGAAITPIRRGPEGRSPFHHGCRLTGRLSRKSAELHSRFETRYHRPPPHHISQVLR